MEIPDDLLKLLEVLPKEFLEDGEVTEEISKEICIKVSRKFPKKFPEFLKELY